MTADEHDAPTPGKGPALPCIRAVVDLVDGLQAPCAILTADADVVHVNPVLAQLLGVEAGRLRGVALGSTGDPLGVQLRPAVLHVGESGAAATIDLVGPAMGMPELPRHFHIRLVPLLDEDGVTTLVCAIGQGSRRSESESDRLLNRFEVLASAGRVLLESRSVDGALGQLVELAIPHLADSAVAHLLEPVQGRSGTIAVAHVEREREAVIRAALDDWSPPTDSSAYERVLVHGEPILLDRLDAPAAASAFGAERVATPLRTPSSVIVVPLRCGGHVVGALELLMGRSGRTHGETDLWIASELATRASIAIDDLELVARLEERADAANVLTHISDGVLLVTGDEVVRVWNPAAEAICGLTREQVIGRPVAEAIPGWSDVRNRIPISDSPRPGGRVEPVELCIDGRRVQIAISGSRFDDGTVYAFTDVTDERRLERLKTDFIATVSHELRTPLASIYGAGATLMRPDIDLDPAQRDDLLQMVVEQSERLASMVNDILEVSMIDAGRSEPVLDRVDVTALLQESIGHFIPLAPDDIEFRLGDTDSLPAVSADPDKLRRVLLNLIENAIKYSPGGGTVRVAAAEAGERVRIEVTDEGIGIEPAAQRRIFERFYRADPEHADGISGTGLGLYISKELIHAMGGSIDVRSTPGSGSTFHVDLPVADD